MRIPNKFVCMLTIILTVSIVLVGLSVRTLLAKSKPEIVPTAVRVRVNAHPLSAESEAIEVELITVRSRGFEPVEINRPEGKVILRLANRSGIPDLAFQLSRENGELVHAFSPAGRSLEYRQLMDLPAGNYFLREPNHPNWVCHISMSPR